MLLLALSVPISLAQRCPPGSQPCPTTMADYHYPVITTDDDNRYVTSTRCPPYANPGWSNPGSACAINTTYTFPLHPKFALNPVPVGEELSRFEGIYYLKEDPAPILGAIGVLVNGVVVYGRGSPCGAGSRCPNAGTGAPSIYVDAVDSEGNTIDQCGGHPQQMGEYHIHSAVTFMNSTGRQMCSLPADSPGNHSVLLGWMFDGFPIYGQYSQGGNIPTALDQCHGHTHEIDGIMTYHYHMPMSYPHIIGCFKGCPEASNNQQLGSLASQYCPNGGLDTDPQPAFEGPGGATVPTTSTASTAGTILASVLVVTSTMAFLLLLL